MATYLITFGAHAMDHIPEEDVPDVADAAHAVTQAMIEAGVLVLAGGLAERAATVVSPDGSVRAGSPPDAVAGITVVDVAGDDEARAWAARIAVACRCDQEVREIGFDPELDRMLREASAGP